MEKLKEGDWVKLSDGTRGMTVVGYDQEGQVVCSYTNEEGKLVEKVFPEADLVKI